MAELLTSFSLLGKANASLIVLGYILMKHPFSKFRLNQQ